MPAVGQTPIHWALLDSVCGGDRREADAMLHDFLAVMPAYRNTHERPVSERDLGVISQAAHRFKSTVAMLGARPLAEALARLQDAAGTGASEVAKGEAGEALAEWDRLHTFLQPRRGNRVATSSNDGLSLHDP